jgi:hypothetical protein
MMDASLIFNKVKQVPEYPLPFTALLSDTSDVTWPFYIVDSGDASLRDAGGMSV